MAEEASNIPPRKRRSRKAVNKAAGKTAASEPEKTSEEVVERGPVSRSLIESVDEALRKLAAKIAEGDAPKDAVVNFEKLHKVRKEMGGDEDQPNLIRVIWEDSMNENSGDE